VPTPPTDTVDRAAAALRSPAARTAAPPPPTADAGVPSASASHAHAHDAPLLGSDPAEALRRLGARLARLEAPVLPDALTLDDARRARLARPATGVVAALAAVPLLGALPFYPTGWAVLLGLLVGLAAVARPLLAVLLLGLLCLPLAGNLALGLVAPVAAVTLLWPMLTAADRRRAFLPALAPVLAALALAPFYLLLAATAAKVHVRFALGAAGPLAVALAAGLAGRPLGLSDVAPGHALAARLAGGEDPLRATRLLLDAAGPGTIGVALAWGALAALGRPALRLSGAAAAWYGAAWLSAVAAATVLGPTLLGPGAAPLAPVAAGTLLAAILLALRAALVVSERDIRHE
jgi:hypothetical protein